MSVSLKKGQKVNLTKENSSLNQILIGLGWDEVKQKKSGIFGGLLSAKSGAIDCDASALLLKNGKLMKKEDIIYFGNLRHKSGSIQHMGDNLTGAGEGDDEQIIVELSKIPEDYDKIMLVVNIYQAVQRNQDFGMIENAFIRLVDGKTNQEMCKYNLTENYVTKTAMIFGEVYRYNNEWKFNAIGEGTTDTDLGSLAKRYM